MRVLFLHSFPGNEAQKLFLGTQNGAFWVGDKKLMLKKFKKFMLKKFMCFFCPLVQKIHLRNWPISSADFPMTAMEGTEHHFGPFQEKGFGAISGGPSGGGF